MGGETCAVDDARNEGRLPLAGRVDDSVGPDYRWPGGFSARQPDENDWIGKRVVPKHGGFTLRIGSRIIDPKEVETYRVERVKGPWLWLQVQGKGISGWPGQSGRPG